MQDKPEHIPYEKTVIEKRAVTDDSIRLYEEIKEKAYKSILNTIELKDNSFNFTAMFYEEHFDKVCKYRFTLNGKEIAGEVKSSELDFAHKRNIVEHILKKLSDHIATNVLVSLQRDIIKAMKS